jgi:hypothetical protein
MPTVVAAPVARAADLLVRVMVLSAQVAEADPREVARLLAARAANSVTLPIRLVDPEVLHAENE